VNLLPKFWASELEEWKYYQFWQRTKLGANRSIRNQMLLLVSDKSFVTFEPFDENIHLKFSA
jgi:hypothetical protein